LRDSEIESGLAKLAMRRKEQEAMDMNAKAERDNSRVLMYGSWPPKKWWTFWKWFERILFTSGLGLLAIYGAVRLDNSISSRAALKSFAALESSGASVSESYEGNSDTEETGLKSAELDSADVPKERQINQPGAPIGVLEIPKIRLEVPVFDGTDKRTLSRGVGRIAGTARPGDQGNIGIAGHRDSYFRGLKEVGIGDVIELRTVKGTDVYIVDEIHIVAPSDVSVLRPRLVSSLTLVTCYPFYFVGSAPQRYIVMASLTHETSNGSGHPMPDSEPLTNTAKKEKQ
jgi:sortase A